MPDSLQLSIDLATSLSIIIAAGAFIYQQWKENYEKKELGLWQEIREVIDSLADTMLESIKILIQLQYNAAVIQARQENSDNTQVNSDNTLEAEFTEFLKIIETVKFRLRLDSKPKIEALLKRHDTYEAKKNTLDKIFDAFNRECDALIDQTIIMRRGAIKLSDKNTAVIGLNYAIVGDEFRTSEVKAAKAAEGSSTNLNLKTLFNNFSEALLDLAHD